MSEGAVARLIPRVVAALSTTRAILFAILVIVVWAISGPLLGFSDVWQLTINTGTTIVTFVVGFCILYSSRLESKALHTKLDAIIEALQHTDNKIVGLEDQGEDVIDEVRSEVHEAAED